MTFRFTIDADRCSLSLGERARVRDKLVIKSLSGLVAREASSVLLFSRGVAAACSFTSKN